MSLLLGMCMVIRRASSLLCQLLALECDKERPLSYSVVFLFIEFRRLDAFHFHMQLTCFWIKYYWRLIESQELCVTSIKVRSWSLSMASCCKITATWWCFFQVLDSAIRTFSHETQPIQSFDRMLSNEPLEPNQKRLWVLLFENFEEVLCAITHPGMQRKKRKCQETEADVARVFCQCQYLKDFKVYCILHTNCLCTCLWTHVNR